MLGVGGLRCDQSLPIPIFHCPPRTRTWPAGKETSAKSPQMASETVTMPTPTPWVGLRTTSTLAPREQTSICSNWPCHSFTWTSGLWKFQTLTILPVRVAARGEIWRYHPPTEKWSRVFRAPIKTRLSNLRATAVRMLPEHGGNERGGRPRRGENDDKLRHLLNRPPGPVRACAGL
jgi:hypothetical protein